MKSRSMLAITIIVLAVFILSVAQQRSRGQTMATGDAFLKQAAEINLGEVQLGKLAEQKGNNPAIRDFGKRMVEDHTKAEDNLRQIAQQQGVTLPSNAGQHVATLQQQLSGATGAQFDQIYIEHMLSGHKGAIDAFENEIEHGSNPAIKGYAESTLSVIQDHIRIAEDVAGKMGLSGAQGLESPPKAIAAPASPK